MTALSSQVLQAFETVPDLYIILSPELMVLTASNAYLEATLTKREKIIGKYIFEVFPESPATTKAHGIKNLKASFQQVLRTKRTHRLALQHYDVPRADGGFEEKYWSPFSTPVLDAQGEVIYIIHKVQEVTELVKKGYHIEQLEEQIELLSRQAIQSAREQTQKALQSKALLQSVFDASFNGISVLRSVRDEQGELVDMEYLMANHVTKQVNNRFDLEGKLYSQVHAGFKATGYFQIVKQVVETGEPHQHQMLYNFEHLENWFNITTIKLNDGVVISFEDITKIKKAELALQQQQEQKYLELKLSQQKALAQAIIQTQEEERKRIAENLHNGVAQLLYAVKLNLDQLDFKGNLSSVEALREVKQKTENLLSEAIEETRRVAYELTPLLLEQEGLEVAIGDFCRRLMPAGMHLSCHVFSSRLEKYLETAIYRICQELVNNILKHSAATRARIEVFREGQAVIIEAQDNGKGFDRQQLTAKGIGLRMIQDRVKLLDGTFELDSSIPQRTLITISLPLS